MPTTISFLGWRNSQRWLLLAAAAAAAAVGRQAASNTGYLLHLHLLHLLLLVLSICLLPRTTRRDLCSLRPCSVHLLSRSLCARARQPPLHRRRWNHHHHPELPTIPLPSRHSTHGTLRVLLRNRIAATPVALRATPICARACTHIHIQPYVHVDNFIHVYIRKSRLANAHTHLRTHTMTVRSVRLVPNDAYVHTRAYTRAQRPSVALCLRPEISLACLANHGLDNNTVIDRTNPVLLHLLHVLLLRDHYRLVQPTASSKRVTFHPSREWDEEKGREGERERERERERPAILRALLTFSHPFSSPMPSVSLQVPSTTRTTRYLLSPCVCDFLFPLLFPSRRREREAARDYACRVLTRTTPLPHTRTGSLVGERKRQRESERVRERLYFYVIKTDTRKKRAR